jgi:hypothetical protein
MSGTWPIRKSPRVSARQPESVRRKSAREHWPRRREDDGMTQALIDSEKPRALGRPPAKQANARPEEGKIAALEAHVATLKEAVSKAEAAGEHHRLDAVTTRNRLDEMIAELVDMSKRLAEQAADHSAYRRRPWWKRFVG